MSQTAFPAPRTTDGTPRMSLRDYFAAHAMVALMQPETLVAYESAYEGGRVKQEVPYSIADHAYMFADAMIARSAKE